MSAQGTLSDALLPIAQAFQTLPHLVMTMRQAWYFCNGVRMSLGQFAVPVTGRTAVYREDGVFLAVAEPDASGQQLCALCLFHLEH